MKHIFIMVIITVLMAACQTAATPKQEAEQTNPQKERKDVPDKFKWNLNHIYKDMDAFNADFKAAEACGAKLKAFEGKLGEKEQALQALDAQYSCIETLWLLDSYAGNQKNSEISNVSYQALSGKVEALFTAFASATSFIDPEFLSLPEDKLKAYLADPAMKNYDRYFTLLIRQKPHTLSKGEEKIIASYSSMEPASYETYNTFTSAELPNPRITLSSGETIDLNQMSYGKYRTIGSREDRKALFEKFWKGYDSYKNTLAKMLNYQTKYYVTQARARNYSSSLEKRLYENEIPTDFYPSLIKHVRDIIPALHEYVQLKKDMLKVDKVEFYDMYVPLVQSTYKDSYSYDQGMEIINAAMEKMPQEYRDAMKLGLTPGSGWIDLLPTKDHYTGAYCNSSAYKIHPYVIMNWNDDYESVDTIAHEMGHAMHSYFSNKYQPFSKSNYSMFVAEVSSIFNEMLLINYHIDHAKSKDEKIFLLNYFIEMMRTTVFRQMSFAEFEYTFFNKVEKGESLTPDFLSKEYQKISNDYYGASKGIYNMEDRYSVEWAYIPHFYYNYYVYQYVVGYIGALSLATKVIEGTIKPEQYVNGLSKAGSSKPPLEILKDAGVDMTTDEPYKLTERVFKKRLAELKALIAEDSSKK